MTPLQLAVLRCAFYSPHACSVRNLVRNGYVRTQGGAQRVLSALVDEGWIAKRVSGVAHEPEYYLITSAGSNQVLLRKGERDSRGSYTHDYRR